MSNISTREQARKDLRKYDNPENGRNKHFQDKAYLQSLIIKYGKEELLW